MESRRLGISQHPWAFKEHRRPDGRAHISVGTGNNHSTTATTQRNLELPVTGTKDDFVRSWLMQIEEDEALGGIYNKNKHQRSELLLPEDSMSSHNPYQDENRQIKMTGTRRRHASTSDSSLLESAASAEVGYRIRHDAPDKYRKRDKTSSRQVKRKAGTSNTEAVEQPSKHRETFEKRPRHKTREDLYEPKNEKRKSESRSREKRHGAKRVKKGDRKRAARRTGDGLMRNFSSQKIAHERLTFLPSHGLGLFNNGRTSSPQGHRGLPDLASSGMMFLQHLTRASARKKQDELSSKSGRKDRRRVEREQAEISTFFKSRRAPLEDAEGHLPKETSSTYVSREEPITRKQISDHGLENEHSNLRISGSKPRASKLGQPTLFSRTDRTPRGSSHSRKLPRQQSDSPGHWPRNGTSCVTWSDTQKTPIVTLSSRQQIDIGRSQTSPTPDSIRRSIEKTGIFRDTGIDSTVAFNSSRETTSRDKRTGDTKILCNLSKRNKEQGAGSTTPSSILFGSHEQRKVPLKEGNCCQEESQKNKEFVSHRTHDEHSSKEYPRGRHSTVGSEPDQAVLEPSVTGFVEQLGSIKSTPPPAAALSCSQISMYSISPPMTREQLAQKARIRRKPVTLSASDVAKTEMLLNEDEVGVTNSNNTESQENVNKSNTDDTAAYVECTTAPDKGSGAETLHGSRVEETMHDVQETVRQENPTIAHFESQMYLTKPAITKLVAEAFDSGCIIAESAATLDQADQMQAHSITENISTTHPIQGPFINWIKRSSSQPSYLLPAVGYSQVDTVHFHDAEHTHYEVDNMGEQFMFTFDDEKDQVAAYVDDTGYGPWEDAYSTIDMQGVNCINNETTNLGGPEVDHEVQPVIPESLEGEEWLTYREMGDSEYRFEDLGTGCQITGDIFPENTTNAPYWDRGANIEYEETNNDVGDALKGFWRPHRPY